MSASTTAGGGSGAPVMRSRTGPNGEHPYARAQEKNPESYYNYERAVIDWGTIDPYIVHKKIGQGKFSEVFVGQNRLNGEPCVVKCLKPVKNKKILREITLLQHIFGAPNVVKLLDIALDSRTTTAVLVFEYVQNTDFRTLYPTFTNLDIQYYMYELLKTLEFVHSMGIFHRDVKPQNIMIDHSKRKIRLIDWGLGEYYHLGQDYNTRVASRYYKGPELLVGFRYYDYSLDIWSLGCVLAGFLFNREPFFQGRDNVDQLVQIIKILGTDDLTAYVERLQIKLPNAVEPSIKQFPKKSWASLVTSRTSQRATPLALDLLDKMLVIDHADRILPCDAMKHPYFDELKKQRADEQQQQSATVAGGVGNGKATAATAGAGSPTSSEPGGATRTE